MTVGEYKGKKVAEAKPLIKAMLIEQNEGDVYYEPESLCTSRSGDICVVSYCDQWYITYGTEEAKEKLKAYVKSDDFNAFNESIRNAFIGALDWLRDWGCSRSFGLGTRLPCDDQFLIESLSDSTIYMSYYTVSAILHIDLYGKVMGKYNVKPEDITEEDWDFVFLKKQHLNPSKLPIEMLKEMKQSFEYWYPFDLRCSGKDLIKNHLTMSLYNHEFIWGHEKINMLPKGIFCNGWVLVDGDKMSKSKGNFLLLGDVCETYSADVLRLSLASSGDTLEDANIEVKSIDTLLLRLATLENWLQEVKKNFDLFREESDNDLQFYDTLFESKLLKIVLAVESGYENMAFREIMKEAFFGMIHIKDEYRLNCGNKGFRQDLIKLFVEIQLLILYPIIPHFTEVMWIEIFHELKSKKDNRIHPKYISQARFPIVDESRINVAVLKEIEYLTRVGSGLRSSCEKIIKKKPGTKFGRIILIIRRKYFDWQVDILKYLQTLKFDAKTKEPIDDWKKEVKNLVKDPKNSKKAFEFASFKIKEYAELGHDALSHEITFDEESSIKKHVDLILKDSVDVGEVVVIEAEEAAKSTDKNINQNVENCRPGNPIIAFEFK